MSLTQKKKKSEILTCRKESAREMKEFGEAHENKKKTKTVIRYLFKM